MENKKKNIEPQTEEELINKAEDELSDNDLDSVAGGVISPVQGEVFGTGIK